MRNLATFVLVIAGIGGIVMAQKAQDDKKDSQSGKAAEQVKTQPGSPEDLEEKLAELDEQAAERDQEFAERDQEFAERDQELAERDQEAAEIDQQFAERDQEFAERDQEAAERDQELMDQDDEQDAPAVASKPAPHVSANP